MHLFLCIPQRMHLTIRCPFQRKQHRILSAKPQRLQDFSGFQQRCALGVQGNAPKHWYSAGFGQKITNRQLTIVSTVGSFMVPLTGLEPVRYRYRGILSPLCLPIPPQRHIINNIIFIPFCQGFFPFILRSRSSFQKAGLYLIFSPLYPL